MKKVLTNINEPGRVLEVVEPGEEFETHPDFIWVDCDNNNVTIESTYTIGENGEYEWQEFNLVHMEIFQQQGYKIARMLAYQDVGEQLDMIYKELMATGTLSSTGDWATHITNVKNTIPKDDPQAVQQWYDDTKPQE